jgi:hypothetical protein
VAQGSRSFSVLKIVVCGLCEEISEREVHFSSQHVRRINAGAALLSSIVSLCSRRPEELLTICTVSSLQATAKYSDLTIFWRRESHRVHKAVMCPRSSFFAGACRFGKVSEQLISDT